ncbi:MAG: hypothetical protein ACTHMM_18305 [Agriterribacter sp.]
MSKIQTISISNFKAIDKLEADFNGCTAIITGANNKGKTSFLRGIPDRIRFIRPDVMVREGEESGKGEMTLDSGEKFIWEFNNDKKDKLTFVTKQGVKQPVTVELGKRFFPPMFDIDKFLQSPPKDQAKQLQKIIGLDFTDIDERYKIAYDDRTEKNREAEKFHAKLSQMLKVDPVEPVDVTDLKAKVQAEKDRLNKLYLENKQHNKTLRDSWDAECRKIDKECSEFNNKQIELEGKIYHSKKALKDLVEFGYDGDEVSSWITSLGEPEEQKSSELLYPAEPDYIEEIPCRKSLDNLESELLTASETNTKAQDYKNYLAYKKQVEDAKVIADEADVLVKSIEDERLKMIQSAQMPKGIDITREGITVDGFPLDKNQISLSKLYTSALRIASLGLGEVKTLYFDASNLDRNNLQEIQTWAQENDLQLLIERPDFDAGEIKYQIIQNS